MADDRPRVLRGFNHDDERYEPGDDVPELPERTRRHLVRKAVISDVGEPDLSALRRSELDAKAREIGVADPEKLPNKEAVVEAIAEEV